MNVHRFSGNTSAEVYAFTQTSDTVKDGDVLVVPDEGVVGVMVSAWPVAVSADPGAFHGTADGFDWDLVDWDADAYPKSYRASYERAKVETWFDRVRTAEPSGAALAERVRAA